ncbi:unnamed protein product [Closterium sp. NIES-53]
MDGEHDPDHPGSRFIRAVQRQAFPAASLSDPTPVLPQVLSPFRTPDPPRTALLPPFPGRIALLAASPGQLPRDSGNTIPGAASSSSSSGGTGSSAQSRQSGLRLTRRLDLAVAESGAASGEGGGLRGSSGGGDREQRGRKQRRILPSEDEVKAAAAGHLGGHVAGHFGAHVAGHLGGHDAATFQRFFGGSNFGAAAGGANAEFGEGRGGGEVAAGEGFPGVFTPGYSAADLDALRHGSDLHSQLAHLLQLNAAAAMTAAATTAAAANPSAAATAANPESHSTLQALGLLGGNTGGFSRRGGEGRRIEGGVLVGEMERGLWDMGGGVEGRMGGMGGGMGGGMSGRMNEGMSGGMGGRWGGGMSGGVNEEMNRLEGMRGDMMAGQATAPPPSVTPTDLRASLSLSAATAGDFHRAAPGFCMTASLQPLAGDSLGGIGFSSSGGGLLYECRFCGKGFAQSQALGGHMNTHRRGWLGEGEMGEVGEGLGVEWGGIRRGRGGDKF